jgi:hypothetical protein
MICSHGPDIIEVKLADFGLSRIVDGETMPGSYAGTHQYQPPVSHIQLIHRQLLTLLVRK